MKFTAARVPALDGLRGVAVLLVVVMHTQQSLLPGGGAVGVTAFFVLSGYVISRGLLARRPTLREFWTRRARRLLPAVVPILICAVLLWAIGDPRSPDIVAELLLFVTYRMNVVLAAGHSQGALAHTWSLAMEEQFYLCWPIVLAWMIRRRWRLSTVIGYLLATAAAWRLIGIFTMSDVRVYFGPDTCVFTLLAGCWLAALEHEGRLRHVGRPWAGVAVLLGLSLVDPHGPLLGLVPVVAVAATMCIIVPGRSACAPLRWALLRWFGTVSYGWYLWHGLLVRGLYPPPLLAWALTVVSLGAAAASWYLLERRWLTTRGDPRQSGSGRLDHHDGGTDVDVIGVEVDRRCRVDDDPRELEGVDLPRGEAVHVVARLAPDLAGELVAVDSDLQSDTGRASAQSEQYGRARVGLRDPGRRA